MARRTKEAILKAYRDLARETGRPIGIGVFRTHTGISSTYWCGGDGYWRNWSDFQKEAGFAPTIEKQRLESEIALKRFVLERFLDLWRELQRMPTEADLQLRQRSDPTFPDTGSFARWGGLETIVHWAIVFAQANSEFADMRTLLGQESSPSQEDRPLFFNVKGCVYLIRSGKSFKLGRSSGTSGRPTDLPMSQKAHTIHFIETDDPEGIEAYWRKRFANRRRRKGSFSLSEAEIAAFKQRRFQ